MLSPCVKCSYEDGGFFKLENTKVAGYCQQCFSKMIRQKFAFCLGKNRVFKDQQRREALIVCYCVDIESFQLLRLVREAITEQNVHKRLRLSVQVLYLSNASSFANASQDAEQCRLLSNDFPKDWVWHFAHESSMFSDNFRINDEELLQNSIEHYNELFASCQSTSVQDELKRLLRVKLICRLCEHEFRCSTILVPDTADQLARCVLNALCFGRVASLSQMTSMVDNRFEPVQIVRPFRDISLRELEAMHCIESNGINHKSSFTVKADMQKEYNGNLQTLTANFIQELRTSGFPATVSTILSVSTKVDSRTGDRKCLLCYELFNFEDVKLDQFNQNEEMPTPRNKRICQNCLQLISDSGPKLQDAILNAISNFY